MQPLKTLTRINGMWQGPPAGGGRHFHWCSVWWENSSPHLRFFYCSSSQRSMTTSSKGFTGGHDVALFGNLCSTEPWLVGLYTSALKERLFIQILKDLVEFLTHSQDREQSAAVRLPPHPPRPPWYARHQPWWEEDDDEEESTLITSLFIHFTLHLWTI